MASAPDGLNQNGMTTILVNSVNSHWITLVERLQYANQNGTKALRGAPPSVLAEATERKHVERWQNSSVQLTTKRRADRVEMKDEVSILH
jgi:hypothetical protein